MSQRGCTFLDQVKHKQRRFWLSLLIWLIGIIVFVSVVTLLEKPPDELIDGIFFASALLFVFLPILSLYRFECPHCHGAAGANPFIRYRFIFCKACGKRIECTPRPPG
jgi:hypothetical protein